MPVIPAAQAERERRAAEAKSELERRIAEDTVAERELEPDDISDDMDDDEEEEDTQRRTMTTKNLFAKSELLYIDAKNITATGYEIEGGFVVCKGSQAVVVETESLRVRFKNVMRIRKELIERGILRNLDGGVLVLTKDHTFDSANIAANVVLGYSGDIGQWKDKHGVSLKKIRKQKSVS